VEEMDMKSSTVINKILLICSLALILLTTGFNNRAIGKSMMDNVAIKGYDSVAYFKEGKALKGSESFTFQWHNMTWYFSTKDNRDLFAAAPNKYAPQYDGYCAWAMTEGRLAITDPEVWKIVEEKLYLNCSQAAYEKWSKDIPGNIKKADVIWKGKYEKK
jgi:YHS domain-containing protein